MGAGASSAAADSDEEEEHDPRDPVLPKPPRKRGDPAVVLVSNETTRGGFIPVAFGEQLLRIDPGMGKCRVRVIDVELQKQIRTFGDAEKSVTGMLALSDKRLVVRYAEGAQIECFDFEKGESVWEATLPGRGLVQMMLLLDGGNVVCGTATGEVARVSSKDGALVGGAAKFHGYGGVSALLVEPIIEDLAEAKRRKKKKRLPLGLMRDACDFLLSATVLPLFCD